MQNGREFWLRIRGWAHRVPGDLFLVVLATLMVNVVVFLPGLQETPLRVVLGLAFVVSVPGYALVSALFPEADQSMFRESSHGYHDDSTTDRWDITGVERVALSFGLTVAVVPLIGLSLSFTPWGFRLVPMMLLLSAFTLLATVVAARRRLALPAEKRFQVWLFPFWSWTRRVRSPETRLGALLNLTLLLGILIAAGSVGFVLATPSPADATTGFYLLTENETGGLVTADYPEEMVVGEPATLTVGVHNGEFEPVEYTVVVQLQRVELEDDATRVVERQELGRFERSLAHNGTWRHQHTVTPTIAGEDLRLQYLLYRGDPPGEPTAETAYRRSHLWVDVERVDGSGTA